MSKIYEQHDQAFANVSAFVITKDGERVATVAFKFPKDGAGRLWCYLHIIGVEMVRAYAGGYGYDKRSAAVCAAVTALSKVLNEFNKLHQPHTLNPPPSYYYTGLEIETLFKNIGGKDWADVFRDAGFKVLSAV